MNGDYVTLNAIQLELHYILFHHCVFESKHFPLFIPDALKDKFLSIFVNK